jgi:hypothetical protein
VPDYTPSPAPMTPALVRVTTPLNVYLAPATAGETADASVSQKVSQPGTAVRFFLSSRSAPSARETPPAISVHRTDAPVTPPVLQQTWYGAGMAGNPTVWMRAVHLGDGQ